MLPAGQFADTCATSCGGITPPVPPNISRPAPSPPGTTAPRVPPPGPAPAPPLPPLPRGPPTGIPSTLSSSAVPVPTDSISYVPSFASSPAPDQNAKEGTYEIESVGTG